MSFEPCVVYCKYDRKCAVSTGAGSMAKQELDLDIFMRYH